MELEAKPLGSDPSPLDATKLGAVQNPSGDAAALAAESSKPTRPDWLPESYFDPATGGIKDDFGKHYAELSTAQKAEADRLAAYPKVPEELKFELPKDLKLPDGVTIDEKNQAFVGFRQFVFDKKIDPAVGAEIVGMYVKEKAGEVEALNKRIGEELAKLGPNASARITALRTFLDGRVGPDLSKAVMAGVFTAPQVDAMEKLMLAFSNQGTAPLPGGDRDQTQPEKTIEQRWYGDTQGKAS